MIELPRPAGRGDLRRAHRGARPAQPLEIDLDVEADLAPAGWSDDLADTIDYGALCDAVVAVVEGGDPQLLEHLAAEIAGAVIGVDARITAVTVAVRKLRPPVPHALATSGVRIRRFP
ncbi:dihydroneopterin aldolase [Aquihabitans daechungensis]|uniref:dihydroneopterin aldolase n=1 Tax=Aquihabitans daechungensis TaxID=1052257 RepID=UPI003B9E931E